LNQEISRKSVLMTVSFVWVITAVKETANVYSVAFSFVSNSLADGFVII